MLHIEHKRINSKISKNWKISFSLSLAMLPLLNVYSLSFMGNFSLGMLVAVLYSTLGLVLLIKFSSINRKTIFPVWLIMIYSGLTLVVTFSNPSNELGYVGPLYSLAKLLVWAVLISITGYYLLDYKIFVKSLHRIAIVATIYIIYEAIAVYILGWSIPNAIELGPIVPNYPDYQSVVSGSLSQIRLSSFWVEPAQYGTFMLCVLIILLFDRSLQIRARNFSIVFLCIGIILSTSTASIYLSLLVLFFYLSQKLNKTIIVILYFIIIATPLILSASIDSLDFLKEHGVFGNSIYSSLIKIIHWETSARIGSSFTAMAGMSEFGISKYVGLGMGNEDILLTSMGRDFDYLNSIARTAIGVGYIGLIGYLLFFITNIFNYRWSLLSLVFFSICFLGGFYSGMWFSPDSILYYCAAFYHSQKLRSYAHENCI